MRGQGATYGSSPGVVMYYAEVPLPADFPGSIQGGPGKFFDVSNLQVLKGSQERCSAVTPPAVRY